MYIYIHYSIWYNPVECGIHPSSPSGVARNWINRRTVWRSFPSSTRLWREECFTSPCALTAGENGDSHRIVGSTCLSDLNGAGWFEELDGDCSINGFKRILLKRNFHFENWTLVCRWIRSRSERKIKTMSLAESYKLVRFVGHGILNRAKECVGWPQPVFELFFMLFFFWIISAHFVGSLLILHCLEHNKHGILINIKWEHTGISRNNMWLEDFTLTNSWAVSIFPCQDAQRLIVKVNNSWYNWHILSYTLKCSWVGAQEGAKRGAKSPALAAGFQQPVEIDECRGVIRSCVTGFLGVYD